MAVRKSAAPKPPKNTSMNTLEERRERVKQVDALVKSKIPAFARVAERGMDMTRLAGAATWAITNNPDLANMPHDSLLNSLMISSQIGLYPGPEGDCYLIPRYNGQRRRKECQWQVGYPGLIKLAWRSGIVSKTEGHVVLEGDDFDYELGINPILRHKPLDSGTGSMTHVWFSVHLNTGAPPIFEVMTRAQVEEFRDRYAPRNRDDQIVGPWVSNLPEMGLKTACIKALKFVPTGDALRTAIQMDTLSTTGLSQPTVIDVSPTPGAEPTGASGEAPTQQSAQDEGVSEGTAPGDQGGVEICGKQLKGMEDGFGCGKPKGHEQNDDDDGCAP